MNRYKRVDGDQIRKNLAVNVFVGLLDVYSTKLLMQTVEGYAEHKCDGSGCSYGLVT